ncbi:RluA family pseudouridine synthase [Fictibacillus fluitans]|uniref:Pseudouridine synthase n=1 Tax=Fictibacillus fluitans TaxID=3058422 RepID=A0ABT8HSB0_9BACL|nr:RluA family pseudouridine synthase [Fictibacillus sp. NE201]MDN4523643.1 RluA family pseudouridine synthase [Fictibacillus sp. NE201]
MTTFLIKWTVKEHETGLLREFLRTHKKISKSALVDIKFAGGELLVNGELSTVRKAVLPGDEISVRFPPEEISSSMTPLPMKLDIIFEDNHLLIVNKPAGMPTIPSRYQTNGSLAQGVLFYYEENEIQSTFHAINRLDKDTSGLVMIAKHRFAHSLFSMQQRSKEIKRTYLAGLRGKFNEEKGTVSAHIARNPESMIERMVSDHGQVAVTHFQVLKELGDNSLVALQLETGRTHQIRVHMSHIGHPLLGDDLYGGPVDLIGRQALHSWKVSFYHPFEEKEMQLNAPLPEDLNRLFGQVEA